MQALRENESHVLLADMSATLGRPLHIGWKQKPTEEPMSGAGRRWKVAVYDRIDPVEAEWTALKRPDNSTPFQSFALMKVFYRQLVAKCPETPVVVLVRHPDNRPAGLFPLMMSRRYGLNWLHSDAAPIDYCAPILDPELGPEEAAAVIRAMLAAVPKADLVYFNKMPASFNGRPNPLIGLPNAAKLRFSAWLLPMAEKCADEVQALQHHSFRRNLRRFKRKTEKAHDRVVTVAVGDEITKADIAAFRALRMQSALEKERHNIFEEDEWAGFYKGLLDGQAAPCQPFLSKLTADGETVAVLFGFTDGKRPVAILPASKLGDWKPLAPGLQLFEETALHFRAAGAESFDFSVGDMVYKHRFGCDELPLYDALFAKTLFGHAYFWLWRLKMSIRCRMRKIADC